MCWRGPASFRRSWVVPRARLILGANGGTSPTARRLAVLERDGGCAKCGAPPSWCDAHHVTPVEFGGATDLSNCVMLCVRCHHDVHRAGCIIEASATEVWFIPPAQVDPDRTPQPGGRRLFDAVATPHQPPDSRDIIARTPLAATRVGDARRRTPRPRGPVTPVSAHGAGPPSVLAASPDVARPYAMPRSPSVRTPAFTASEIGVDREPSR
ncbi:HNH endonuclease [Demequina litorisediminis]|uniref:HNH endonuclease n=1 Tax=Demequina litorisediminis TaxID=1849022 RepID=UPI003D672F0E